MTPAIEPQESGRADAPARIRGAVWLGAIFLRIVDSGIPARIRDGDLEELRRARTVLGFTVMLLFLSFESLTYFHFAVPLEAATRIHASALIGLLLILAVPETLRRGLPIPIAANLAIAASFIVIVTLMTILGGIEAPMLHWCALPPMLAVLTGGRRSAWVWAGLGILTLLVMSGASAVGFEFTNYVDPAEVKGVDLWSQRAIELVSWLAILLTVAFVYEHHKDGQTKQLAEKNRELLHEIGQRERAEEKTRYLAYYDELTTLPNRQLFKEQLARAMEHAVRDQRVVALLFLDLDGFKEVNDSHGHECGDKLLKDVARRLLHCVRAVDSVSRPLVSDSELVSRLGGDEFTILLDGIRDFNEAALVARRVLESLSEPVEIGDHEVFITASIGIAIYPGAVRSLDELLRNADLAMYHAKEKGRNNFQFFEASMNEAVVERSTLAHDLRLALERDELELDYQPIVDARSRRVVGAEALVRWRHPERGRVLPDQFIPIAEETGLIVKLGEWVLREACAEFSRWSGAGIAPRRISVNVSGIQFRTQRLADLVISVLEEAKLDPRHLELEITENAMMIDEAETSRSLHRLSDLGVRIAFDDFGTGYSSLSYLKRFPVDVLKIDRSFIGGIESDPEAQAIATAIVAMAHQLSLAVVGEGVETEAQAHFLREHGCDELQGHLLGKPLPPEEIVDHLQRSRLIDYEI